jgi:hypothetical protein
MLWTTTRALATARLDGSVIKPERSAFCASKGDAAATKAVANNANRIAGRRPLIQVNKAVTAENIHEYFLSHETERLQKGSGPVLHWTFPILGRTPRLRNRGLMRHADGQ